jgi:hypothetical protein
MNLILLVRSNDDMPVALKGGGGLLTYLHQKPERTRDLGQLLGILVAPKLEGTFKNWATPFTGTSDRKGENARSVAGNSYSLSGIWTPCSIDMSASK